jgi:hypothetical protein
MWIAKPFPSVQAYVSTAWCHLVGPKVRTFGEGRAIHIYFNSNKLFKRLLQWIAHPLSLSIVRNLEANFFFGQ